MIRIAIIAWLCLGALGLGIVVLEATRRKKELNGGWYFLAVILGPIFLCFILPIWLGKWGERKR